VSQLQANCREWEIEGSRTDENRDLLEKQQVFTFQPKGILVIGQTGQLDILDKRNTFECFRRNLSNPEIITFDELLERARFIVETTSKTEGSASAPVEPGPPPEPEHDVLPF
jgi:hypothetical protein